MNSDFLEKAHELGVDLATTLEDALALEVYRRQREAWLEGNREAIEAYNELVATHGVFSTGLRGFDAPVHSLPEQEPPRLLSPH